MEEIPMITVYEKGGYYSAGQYISPEEGAAKGFRPENGREKTMAYGIMAAHNLSGDMTHLKMRFDAMASHEFADGDVVGVVGHWVGDRG